MINLLDRITAAFDNLTGVLDGRAGQLLEWDLVKAQIASNCINSRASLQIRGSQPFSEIEPINLYRALADEMRPAGEVNQWPPLIELCSAVELLEQTHPIRLEGSDLVQIASVAEELDSLRDYFLAARSVCPLWGEAAVQMATFYTVSTAIRRALDLDGHIVDGASPLLARLRRSVAGQERAVRQEMSTALGKARSSGWTTGSEYTLCGDRFCIPLRSGDSRRVPGIVHERSSTGATLFVEPASVVRLANELAATRLEIAAEEARILFELNRAVEQASGALQEAAAVMLLVDTVRSHLLWSRQVGGRRPTIGENYNVRVFGGRHPLLMQALGEGNLAVGRELVVPLDLEIPDSAKALVISGPNAGGKSVALKTVGVFCLLAQCGWDIPAREDTILPLVKRLLADLGDDQSIAAALSSFSAHLSHLKRFMDEAAPGTLVLCDEIGSGTDPHEGTALAFAVLEKLTASGALVLASTHFGLLKAAVHDHPQMINAAMDYDEQDLQPLFTFRVGDPGTSHAFDIAGRMGFPESLLHRARTAAGQERVQIERLLADLDNRARELQKQQDDLNLIVENNRTMGADLKKRLKGQKKEQRDVLEKTRLQGEQLVKDSRKLIENVVREIRSQGAEKSVVQTARKKLEQINRELGVGKDGDDRNEAIPIKLEVGQRIRIPHLGLIGSVTEVRGNKLVALAGDLRLTLGRDAVRLLDDNGPQQVQSAPVDSSGSWSWQDDAPVTAHEIDLRGETGEEGWQRLDKLLDRAIPAGLHQVNVIHGFGTGKLRDYLYARLNADSRVSSFSEAGRGRGGAGATIVRLRED